MTYRKTWFSYVLWAVYAGICVMLLAFMGYYQYSEYIAASTAKFGGLLIFPVAVGVYWALRTTAQFFRKKYTMRKHTAQMLEVFVAAVSIVFGALYRASYVLYSETYFDLTFASPVAVKDILDVPYATYYEMALVRTGEQITPLTHGAGYLYVLCVSAVCSFLGNRIMSAVLLQAVIQMISVVLGYLVVRKAAGKLPACIVLIFLSFSGVYIEELYRIAPDSLVFMLYLAGLLLVVTYIRDYCRNEFSKPVAVCGAVLAGAVIGILTYLDLKFIVLFVFMIGLFTGRKEYEEGEEINNSPGISVISFAAGIVSCAAGLCVMFGIVALYRGTEFLQDVSAWLELYVGQCKIGLFYSMEQMMPELPLTALIIALASFLVFEFFRGHKEQNYMLWILACILIAPTPMARCGILPYTMIALFQWMALAGLGLQNCVFGDREKVVQAKIEEINASAEPIEENKAQKAEQQGLVLTTEQKAEKQALTAPSKQQAAGNEPSRFIENPLPLPKKHVKKEMDYQYTVEEKDMKYDVEVDDNDEFDLL
ncbi:MAG: hypothetical protein J6A08_01570 [Lachnospiraceae bacterium]|nr:hypothetical protein [Lachnospiraceae bacterium]